jgi:fumarylacetoacetase
VPLGPFLAKNFASTISPWIITPEALAPFKVALPAQDPAMLPYLKDDDLSSYDV